MANFSTLLRTEIQRLARKALRTELKALRDQNAQQRKTIVQLKRANERLERRLRSLERKVGGGRAASSTRVAATEESGPQVRFSPKWVAAHRKKLGLSAAEYGKLVGVSMLTIYNWEHGKSSPRRSQLAKWATIRDIKSKAEAQKRLEQLEQQTS